MVVLSFGLSGCYNVTDIGIAHALTDDVPTLRRLNLSLCKQITDSSLGRLAQYCRQLQELDLGGCCNVTNTGLLLIAWGLKNLKSLNLRSCWHVSDHGIASLAGLNSDAGGNLALEHLGLQVFHYQPYVMKLVSRNLTNSYIVAGLPETDG